MGPFRLPNLLFFILGASLTLALLSGCGNSANSNPTNSSSSEREPERQCQLRRHRQPQYEFRLVILHRCGHISLRQFAYGSKYARNDSDPCEREFHANSGSLASLPSLAKSTRSHFTSRTSPFRAWNEKCPVRRHRTRLRLRLRCRQHRLEREQTYMDRTHRIAWGSAQRRPRLRPGDA